MTLPHHIDSFSGDWRTIKDQLIQISALHPWSNGDIGVIRSMLNHMNGEGALAQWARIDGFGQDALKRALTHG